MAAKRGYQLSKDDYLKRLRRIEGQVRGLQQMITDDRYCIDVLTQIASVSSALQGVSVGLLDEHIRHCVVEAAQGDGGEAEAKLHEASEAVSRLLRS